MRKIENQSISMRLSFPSLKMSYTLLRSISCVKHMTIQYDNDSHSTFILQLFSVEVVKFRIRQ